MDKVEFSVVIPCYNGAATLERQLRALLSQTTARPFEVCVADNRSTDASAEIVRSFASRDPRVRYVEAHHAQGINHARNQGVLASRGPVILLCDADDVVHERWIDAYATVFDGGAELAGGPLRHITDGHPSGDQTSFVASPWKFQWPYGANCAFLRTAFDAVHGFDEAFRGGGDETDFFWRAQLNGFRLSFADAAWVDYYSRDTLGAVLKQKYHYGKAEVRLFQKFQKYGMPRLPKLKAPVAALSALIGVACSPHNRRKYVARLGRNAGLISGSVEQRIWYF